MYSVFEDELGHAIKEANQTIGASLADTTSAKLLGVKVGSPLLSMERLTLTRTSARSNCCARSTCLTISACSINLMQGVMPKRTRSPPLCTKDQ